MHFADRLRHGAGIYGKLLTSNRTSCTVNQFTKGAGMKKISQAVICMALAGICVNPLAATSQKAKIYGAAQTVTPPQEIAAPIAVESKSEPTSLVINNDSTRSLASSETITPPASNDSVKQPALEQSAERATSNPNQSLSNTVIVKQETDIDRMRREAKMLRDESQTLRTIADTLQNDADDAENKAEEAEDKAEDIEDNLREASISDAVKEIRADMERIKHRIKADIERIKAEHGNVTTTDSLTSVQADSIDTLLSRLPSDSSPQLARQKMLLLEIHTNADALIAKSRAMSSKAREMEDAADKRDDLADDLEEKADKLAEEQNLLPLSQRFPLHFGFQLRVAGIGPFTDWKPDVIMMHGMFASYSVTPNVDIGLQDITYYNKQTVQGKRHVISLSPSVKGSLFLTKRLQIGAVTGAAGQIRFGNDQETAYSAAPFLAIFNEIWVRNHFSISPIIRINYAARGLQHTVALSQHSGTLPEGALWMDFGIGYNFNF